jgi:hypothetical protein
MQKTIIVIWGKGGSGKSTTIAYALAELRKHASDSTVKRGRQRPGGPPEVWSAILTIDGVQVGITSPGDNGPAVRRRVKPLIDAGCQVVVCATRTGGGSAAALRELASQAEPPFEIKWIEKVSGEPDSERRDRAACAEIVTRVLEAVASFQLVAV